MLVSSPSEHRFPDICVRHAGQTAVRHILRPRLECPWRLTQKPSRASRMLRIPRPSNTARGALVCRPHRKPHYERQFRRASHPRGVRDIDLETRRPRAREVALGGALQPAYDLRATGSSTERRPLGAPEPREKTSARLGPLQTAP